MNISSITIVTTRYLKFWKVYSKTFLGNNTHTHTQCKESLNFNPGNLPPHTTLPLQRCICHPTPQPPNWGAHAPHRRMVWCRISFTCARSYKSPSNDFILVRWQWSEQRDNNTGVLSVNTFQKCFHAQQRRWKAQTETGRRTCRVKVFTESPWWYTGLLHRPSDFVAWSACPMYTVKGKGGWGKLQIIRRLQTTVIITETRGLHHSAWGWEPADCIGCEVEGARQWSVPSPDGRKGRTNCCTLL